MIEERLIAGRHDQRPEHDYHSQQTIERSVVIVGGREPGEAHPRPPDREERGYKLENAVDRMRLGHGMMQSGGSHRDGDH